MAGDDDEQQFLAAMAALGLGARGARATDDDAEAFARLVAELEGSPGTPTSERGAVAQAAAPRASAPAGERPRADPLAFEDAEFLRAMGGAWPTVETGRLEAEGATAPGAARSGGASPRALARRARQGEFAGAPALVLHGLTREAARLALSTFVRARAADGVAVVRVVTGRGLHSAGDAVLQAAVPGWLRGELAPYVREIVRAPREAGGEGALLVLLSPPKR